MSFGQRDDGAFWLSQKRAKRTLCGYQGCPRKKEQEMKLFGFYLFSDRPKRWAKKLERDLLNSENTWGEKQPYAHLQPFFTLRGKRATRHAIEALSIVVNKYPKYQGGWWYQLYWDDDVRYDGHLNMSISPLRHGQKETGVVIELEKESSPELPPKWQLLKEELGNALEEIRGGSVIPYSGRKAAIEAAKKNRAKAALFLNW